jgi:hypothetical protein
VWVCGYYGVVDCIVRSDGLRFRVVWNGMPKQGQSVLGPFDMPAPSIRQTPNRARHFPSFPFEATGIKLVVS